MNDIRNEDEVLYPEKNYECPSCGYIVTGILLITASADFECPSEGCGEHLSSFVSQKEKNEQS